MLHDLLDIVDLEGARTGEERTVGGFDLIWNDGPLEPLRPAVWTSMLGADFDRRLNPALPPRGPPAAAEAAPPAPARARGGRAARSGSVAAASASASSSARR